MPRAGTERSFRTGPSTGGSRSPRMVTGSYPETQPGTRRTSAKNLPRLKLDLQRALAGPGGASFQGGEERCSAPAGRVGSSAPHAVRIGENSGLFPGVWKKAGTALRAIMVWCFCFLSEDEKKAIVIDKEITRLLHDQKKRERWELKLLLLGTGESGKSTFIKQMRIIHGVGYTEEDRKAFAKVVYRNILASVQALIKAMESLQIPFGQVENAHNAQLLMDLDAYKIATMEPCHAKIIGALWRDTGIQACYLRRSEFHLLDSAAYFLSDLERIASEGYVPNAQDILRTRVPTTGINEYCFSVQKVKLRIVDVGGQKSERRKWIHCFENVIALIYLASLSEYDQFLEENRNENRMRESLDLFRTILELPWFWNTAIILFLNKVDILEEKVLSSDLAAYFPSFPGPRHDAPAAKRFILELYTDIFQQQSSLDAPALSRPRLLYPHYTCATDTQNICTVFEDIKDAVLATYLEEFNLV